jgi:tetratricopeptide (TPR) repeat protein
LLEARALDDRPAEARILWNRLNLYRFTLRLRLARESGERSLAIARALGLREQMALTLNDLVHVYAHSGQWPAAKAVSVEVHALWRQMGNLPMLADSLTTSAMFGNSYGELDMALAHAAEAMELSVTTGNLWGQAYSLSITALPYWYRGDPGRALAFDEQAIRMGDLSGFQWPRIVNRAQMAQIYCQLGDPGTGLALAREALDWAERNLPLGHGFPAAMVAQAHLAEGTAGSLAAAEAALGMLPDQLQEAMIWEIDPVLGARTALALAHGDGPGALAAAETHVNRLRSMGLRLYLPEALLTQARCRLRLGQAAEAATALAEARAETEAMDLPMVKWQILAAQGEAAESAGRLAEAGSLRAAARTMVQAIAERVPFAELRQSFLARPDVRALDARG